MIDLEQEQQVVIFGLGAERFALPVDQIREILDHRPAFHMPDAPPWLLGLTDVRGASVPVIDLRIRLGLAPAETTLATRVLVADIRPGEADASPLVVGLRVDRVLDVSTFHAGSIESPPDIGGRWRSECIAAILRQDDGFVALLDLPEIFAGHDALTWSGENMVGAIAA